MSQQTPAPRNPATATTSGLLGALGAYLLWGIIPIYWPLLERAGALELLAHRVVWSVVVGAILVAVVARGRWRAQLASPRTIGVLFLAAVVVSINWGTFIWAVNNGQVVEASLGYYINPLLSILLGVLVLSERLAPMQWLAIGLTVVAVVILTVDLGRPPWVALTLSMSFALYGLIKKRVKVEPVVSLTVESLLMSIPALIYLGWLASRGQGTFGHHGIGFDLLLTTTGIVTAVPLLLFSFAAQRIPLSTLGMIQYINPTMQFLLGVLYFGEAMSPGRWAGFFLVWIALVVISAHALMTARRRRRERPEVAEPPG